MPLPPPPGAGTEYLMLSDLSDRRVLIVDRHPNARDSLRMMLSSLGVTKVHGAGSAAEVTRQVKGNSFDIIFSDFQLDDGRDGQQLLEELRLQHLIPLSTVFIIVTSERGYRNVVAVAELTPDDYLIKPFTADQLQNRLGRALQRKTALATIYRFIENGAYSKALAACETVIGRADEFFLDGMRLKGEVLSTLGRYADAETLYREILGVRPLPWARMGLATALMARDRVDEAVALLEPLVAEHPNFMAAHDLLARALERRGDLDGAQAALLRAADISPHNTTRQRAVGDIAARNGDLDTAEKAYQSALDRARGSSVVKVDDYANLSRVLLDKGKTALARSVANDLRRDRRGESGAEVAALTLESLCHQADGHTDKAVAALTQAMTLFDRNGGASDPALSTVSLDLAQACLAAGQTEQATNLLRQIATEHAEDAAMTAAVGRVFERAGQAAAGQALLESVSSEIVRINNQGVRVAREGDLDGAVALLSDAAERMPNLKFLVNAANAIFTLLDRRGWQNEQAEAGLRYLIRAQRKDARNPKVVAAGEFMQGVAHKYGISVGNLRQQVIDALDGKKTL